MGKVRKDALPEEMEYRDRGCELAPSCLRCPLPLCRYDVDQSQPKAPRDAQLIAASEVMTVEELAARFGISKRSIYRVLARAR